MLLGMATTKIGVVGLGKMGSSFARRLLEQHFTVSVWDRSPQAVTAFNTAGAVPCDSLASLVAAVDVVIVMLWGDDVAREVTLAQIIPAMHGSQILIEMSTLSPQMYETLEQAARERGLEFVASPVLGNPDVARQGLLTVLPGGERETVQRVREILGSLGTVIEMPSVRASGYFKLANNTILGVVAETLGELLEVSDRVGIDRELAVRTFAGTFQRGVQQKLPQLLADDTEPRFSLSALLKDLHLSRDAAQSIGVNLPVLEVVVPKAESAEEHGLGNRDYIVLALDRADH